LVSSLIGAGAGRPFSCRTCKEILYAALVVHLPLGVSFQHKMSSSSVERMGVLRILLAFLWRNSNLTRFLFHAFSPVIQRYLGVAG
jgi:hypothetical protein